MFNIFLEGKETIGYLKSGKPVPLRIEPGMIVYRKRKDPDWLEYREFYKEDSLKEYCARKKVKYREKMRVFRTIKIDADEFVEGHDYRPLSIQDEETVRIMTKRTKRLKKKHPDASLKQIKAWLWFWSCRNIVMQGWGRSVQQEVNTMTASEVKENCLDRVFNLLKTDSVK